MKKIILCLTVLLMLVSTLLSGCQQRQSVPASEIKSEAIQPLTTEQKLEDFEHLCKILEENYPFFEVNQRMNGIDWLANKEKYLQKIGKTTTDEQYKEALDEIFGDLHNGHTGIINNEFYHMMKKAFGENKEFWKPWLDQLSMENAAKRYGKTNNNQGVAPVSSDTRDYVTSGNINAKILRDKKVAYLSIRSLNGFNLERDMKIIQPFLESIKNYEALIIDIRQNGGGNSEYWSGHIVPMLIREPIQWNKYFFFRGGKFSEPFIKNKLGGNLDKLKPAAEFAAKNLPKAPPEIFRDYKYFQDAGEIIQPKDSVNFKGHIYMLVDREVYSSSEMWASFAKTTGFATLIGETTGGDGIGTDPLVCALPNSGYVFRFPVVMGLVADGSCNEEHKTTPDIQMPAQKTQDIAQDQAIQYVLDLYK